MSDLTNPESYTPKTVRDLLMHLVFGKSSVPAEREQIVPRSGGVLGGEMLHQTPMEKIKIRVPGPVDADMLRRLLSSSKAEAAVTNLNELPSGQLEYTVHFFPKLPPGETLDHLPDETILEHGTMLNLSAVDDAKKFLNNPAIMAPIAMSILRRKSPDQARFQDAFNSTGLTGMIPGMDRVPGMNILGMLEGVIGGGGPDAGARLQWMKKMLTGQQAPNQYQAPGLGTSNNNGQQY